MAVKFNSTAEPTEFKTQEAGDFIFEVVAFGVGVSTGAKTKMWRQAEVKIRILKDGTAVNQWDENMIEPPQKPEERALFTKDQLQTAEFLENRIACFARSTNIPNEHGQPMKDGDDIVLEDYTCIGLRGWCHVGKREGMKDGKPTGKFYNFVDKWLVNKEKLPRNMANAPQPEPKEETPW